ncbi:hypothetical protein SRB17_86830 [Streptomyces sp. RB17]|uniref:hypothetical protein n=1 Tax=Streptomyces sp. RB17 TaxID=2585197 RepID=UPI00129492E9|nr:hypothetical protein [Streptomyces sp. RB17]MQY40650.1 hypothetical protein [Streptomyces sp. RB17]
MRILNVVHERQTPEYWNRLYKAGYRVKEPEAFERQMFRNYTTVKSGMLAVDVGCGRGQMSAHMSKWGLMVLAYDFSGCCRSDLEGWPSNGSLDRVIAVGCGHEGRASW